MGVLTTCALTIPAFQHISIQASFQHLTTSIWPTQLNSIPSFQHSNNPACRNHSNVPVSSPALLQACQHSIMHVSRSAFPPSHLSRILAFQHIRLSPFQHACHHLSISAIRLIWQNDTLLWIQWGNFESGWNVSPITNVYKYVLILAIVRQKVTIYCTVWIQWCFVTQGRWSAKSSFRVLRSSKPISSRLQGTTRLSNIQRFIATISNKQTTICDKAPQTRTTTNNDFY